MTWLGLFTYPVYLVHANWGRFVIFLTCASRSTWVALLLANGASFLLAWVIIVFVECSFGPCLRRAFL